MNREMLVLAAEGNREAFHRMYEKYSPYVHHRLRKLVTDPDTCAELHQAVFVKLWERRALLKNVANLEAYINQLLRNMVVSDVYRKQRRDALLHSSYEPGDAYWICQDHTEFRECRHLWQTAIDRLTPRQKEVYELVEQEDLSLNEAADTLQIAKHTLKNHLEVARRSVRTYLQQYL
ncbi:RNA polymerase sigma factor [Filimonas effusa]|uniref:Sigma-70 family RNA polymerase sigma factor n=1 Tax=Filimonas effusa TaxID=2508721 RepID=A0A4Q1DBQ9_9BACT|nr:sigma-70 family RNA polymerase sigma factor [Filimonas effusa]RXK86368.1 sigma-70 family RNA polymerase sigma factor [Filimonas effusa]